MQNLFPASRLAPCPYKAMGPRRQSGNFIINSKRSQSFLPLVPQTFIMAQKAYWRPMDHLCNLGPEKSPDEAQAVWFFP